MSKDFVESAATVAELSPTNRPPDSPTPAQPSPFVKCRACGYENPTGANLCQRATCRRTLPGNALNRLTGLYAGLGHADEALLEAAGPRLVDQSIADAGGQSELSARELTAHQYRGVLHVRILKLQRALELHGEFDKRGRLRRAWIELMDRLITSAVSLDMKLGYARRPRPVDGLSPSALKHTLEHGVLDEVGDGE